MEVSRVEVVIEAPLASVWTMVATPRGWDRWFTSGASFTLAEGERYRTADRDTGVFLRIDPLRGLSFTWEHPKHPPGSAVELSIEPHDGTGDRCLIRITHGPLAAPGLAAEVRQAWNNVLGALKREAEAAS